MCIDIHLHYLHSVILPKLPAQRSTMFLFLAVVCLLPPVMRTEVSEKVTWLTAYKRCRNQSGYIADTDKADHWSNDFWIKAFFRETGCYDGSTLTSSTAVTNHTQCYLHCSARSHPYFGVRETGETILDCLCFKKISLNNLTKLGRFSEKCRLCGRYHFSMCGKDDSVYIYKEVKEDKKDFKVDIECNDRISNCVTIMKNNKKIEVQCEFVKSGYFGNQNSLGSCKNNNSYECKGGQFLQDSTPTIPSKTTSIILTSQQGLATLSTSAKIYYETTNTLTDFSSIDVSTSNDDKKTFSLPTTMATDDSTTKNIQENITNAASSILKEPNAYKDKSSGVPTLGIVIGTVVGVVVVVALSILLKWKLRKQISTKKTAVPRYINVNMENQNRNNTTIKSHESQQSNDNQVYFILEPECSNNLSKPLSNYSNQSLLDGGKSPKNETSIKKNVDYVTENKTNSKCIKTESKALEDVYKHLDKKDSGVCDQQYDTMVSVTNSPFSQNYDHINIKKTDNKDYDSPLNDYDSMAVLTVQREQNYGEYDQLAKDDQATMINDVTYYSEQSLEENDTDYDVLGAKSMEEESTYFDTVQDSHRFEDEPTLLDTYINHSSILHCDINQHQYANNF